MDLREWDSKLGLAGLGVRCSVAADAPLQASGRAPATIAFPPGYVAG